jgi:hypothetical protein
MIYLIRRILKIPRFSKYLKEGIEIYLREISNINESKIEENKKEEK